MTTGGLIPVRVYLPPEVYAALRARAGRRGMSRLLAQLLADWLREEA